MTRQHGRKHFGKSLSAAVVLAGSLALTGCIGQQESQLSQCEAGAPVAVPGQAASKAAATAYITQCMQVAGFKYTPEVGIDECRGGSTNERNAYCYLPQNQVKKVVFWALYM